MDVTRRDLVQPGGGDPRICKLSSRHASGIAAVSAFIDAGRRPPTGVVLRRRLESARPNWGKLR
jgi:hypothetical protein